MKAFNQVKSSAHKPKKKSPVREWISALLFAVITASLVRWAAIEAFMIPSASMEQTLLTGDFILVSKLHYGTRTPQTPLQVPLMHQTIRNTQIPAYLDWIQLPMYRLPGFSPVKRGDAMVFNCITELDKPVDIRTYYIKRCIGLPGDEVCITNGQVQLNGEQQPDYVGLQHPYYLQTAARLNHRFFKQYSIHEYRPVQGGYLIHATSDTVKQLEKLSDTEAVKLITAPQLFFNPAVFPHSSSFAWNEDHWGPIKVPKKGMEIALTSDNLEKYQQLISLYEGHQDVNITDHALWIDGVQVTHYIFKKDYYFVMGDNRSNSVDSRFWGFVPDDHVVGKAVLVLFSADPQQQGWQKIRWNRFFRLIRD